MKKCSKCGQHKAASSFGLRKASKDGMAPWCSQCFREYSKKRHETKRPQLNAYAKAWYKKWKAANPNIYEDHKEKYKDQQFRYRYGITLSEWTNLLTIQNGVCAICAGGPKGKQGKSFWKGWHTDHDHVTGKVRGILCPTCNRLLGAVKDSPTTLRSAADYLEKHRA